MINRFSFRFGKPSENLRLINSRESGGSFVNNSILALLYPSVFLAGLTDPLREAAAAGAPLDPHLAELTVRRALRGQVQKLRSAARLKGQVDDRWYWAAPLLLDGPGTVTAWLRHRDPFSERSGSGGEALRAPLTQALRLISDAASLGRPPSDLVEVLARLALAGPGVCALRALCRADPEAQLSELQRAAFRIARGFQALFNQTEAAAAVELEHPRLRAYWRQALAYAHSGGVQALLEEQVHLEWEGVSREAVSKEGSRLQAAASAIHDAASLRRVHVEIRGGRRRSAGGQAEVLRLRCRHAVRFSESRDGSVVTRLDAVRAAFNSPFRPFVLASTSVGQEGLDFHQWCHAVVHWNLPQTPVELEQREGRVNRYKGHAVRLNLARGVGLSAISSQPGAAAPDPWSAMFSYALQARKAEKLAPYWIFESCSDPVRIQRIVPLLAFSRESDHWPSLQRRLGLYRLALGLPRYNDLLIALDRSGITLDQSRAWRIDLQPPPTH